MYLKSIELQGFKSFPDKTVLSFDQGITVVIGPNGSGKSNIADAVRWVLGEVSSRNIRGTKMEDVIFGGCETKKPSSYAQVSLSLDNSSPENRLDIDYDTVTVTRRYFRGGDSDYLINGKAVRLKDIHKLFMNTGIGRGGYSVIGQGKIAEIISQKSEDRRNVFEEAAGISRFKFSRDEAEKKLKGVNENLTRICDIAGELESRIQPLEKASEKARKYLLLYDEKKQVDISLWLYDMAQSSQNIAKLRGMYELYKGELEAASQELSDIEEKTEKLFEQSQQNKRATECANDKLNELNDVRNGKGTRVIEVKTQSEHLKNSLSELSDSIEELRLKLENAIVAEKEKCSLLDTLKLERENVNSQIGTQKQKYDSITAELEELSKTADRLSARIAELKESETEQRIKLTVLDTTDKAQAQQAEELLQKQTEIKENAEQIEKKLAGERQVCEEYERQLNERKNILDSLADKLLKLNGENEKLKSERSDNYVKSSTISHRADNLRRMAELLEGYSHSVKFVMDEYKAGRIRDKDGRACDKIYAPVSMLISVKQEYATAVETSLGAAMQNIVVENEAAAKAAMYCLKKNNAGRCTFYPISTVKPQYLSYRTEELAKNDGFVGIASELVECDEKFSDIIKNLLGRTVVFTDIDRATVFAKKYGYKIKIVTLDGQQINAGGSFTGGSARNDSGMLSRGAELEKLTKQLKALKDDGVRIDRLILEKENEIKSCETEKSKQEGNLTILSSLLNQEQLQYNILQNRYNEEVARLEELKNSSLDREKLENERREIRNRGERELKRIEDEIGTLEISLADTEKRIADGNEKQEQYRRLGSELLARLSGLDGEISQVTQVCMLLTQSREELQNQTDESMNKKCAIQKKLEENMIFTQSGDKAVGEYDKQISELKKEIAQLNSDGGKIEVQLSKARNDEKEKSRNKELLLREYTQAENKLNNAENEKTKLIAFLNENYELTYAEAKELAEEKKYPEITAAQRSEAAKHQTELKNKLRALGEVNVNAIEEYKTVKERYDFMSGQIDDLEKSKSELEAVIFKAQEEMKISFLDAFDRINEQFEKVFVHLFGGGSAELVLKDPDDVLNTGIEINAAPPGKIIKSLSLLSGGEQSFVAIALYFALINVNPTPFILLDEIDSALDEVNVDRFGHYVTECKNATQFILISHRRGTMESADMLYGVTMQTKGISKVLSVNVDEIEQKIGRLN